MQAQVSGKNEKTFAIFISNKETPNEYDQGHIPGAYNLPLFSNQERITVGTLFKKAGRGTAMTAGIEVVRPKFQALVEQAQAFMAAHLGGTDASTSSSASRVHR